MSGKRRFRLLPSTTKGRLATATVALLVLAGIALAGYLYEKHRTGDIYHPQARFVPQPTPTLPKAKGQDRFAWPLYGYTKNHTRFFPASPTMRPPFRTVWTRSGSALLEFPPVMSGNRIFQLDDDATLGAIDKYTGQTLWSRRLGALSASTPAVAGNTVYATVLSRSPGSQAGRVVALNTLNGHFRWTRDLPSRAESSPLLDKGKLFFGSQNGTVYALNASNGNVLWTYHAAGAVKAEPKPLWRGALLRRLLRRAASGGRGARASAVAQRFRRRPTRQRHFLLDPSGHVRQGVPWQHRRTRICL